MTDHHYELLEYCVIGNKLHVLYARPTWYVKDGEFTTTYEHYIFDKNKKLSNHGQMHLGLGTIKQGINDITTSI